MWNPLFKKSSSNNRLKLVAHLAGEHRRTRNEDSQSESKNRIVLPPNTDAVIKDALNEIDWSEFTSDDKKDTNKCEVRRFCRSAESVKQEDTASDFDIPSFLRRSIDEPLSDLSATNNKTPTTLPAYHNKSAASLSVSHNKPPEPPSISHRTVEESSKPKTSNAPRKDFIRKLGTFGAFMSSALFGLWYFYCDLFYCEPCVYKLISAEYDGKTKTFTVVADAPVFELFIGGSKTIASRSLYFSITNDRNSTDICAQGKIDFNNKIFRYSTVCDIKYSNSVSFFSYNGLNGTHCEDRIPIRMIGD